MGSAEAPWRILEFYSGIGAMRYSLMRAGINGDVIEAFDINDTANDVYEHNFGHRPFQGNIQTLGAVELDKYGADAWLLSPPCQPYTRQGLQKHSADARAFSFIKIIELIQHMKQAPKLLFVENVVGFETSDTHEKMLEILRILGFSTQEFILSPLQFGIPYSRPRYFCLAKRRPLSFQNPISSNQLLRTPAPYLTQENLLPSNGYHLQGEFALSKPLKNFLVTKNVSDNQLEGSCEEVEEMYIVPRSLIERWGNAMDIVYPDSNRCCCFTKSYYRYVKGTGSLLATSSMSENRLAQKPEVESLLEMGLRYFTPREVANLHSFPEEFQFPKHITLRQQYALLGNSMSVAVVAPLLSYLFSKPTA